jgi:hypothetical protein
MEAISILERRSDVWAVVTDVQMPGPIDGRKREADTLASEFE